MYYILSRPSSQHPCRWIDDEPFVPNMNFQLGKPITTQVPNPLEFTLEPLDSSAKDCGPDMPAVFIESILLFRDDLIEALHEFGISNFDCYDATILDPDDTTVHKNYKAVNIIGIVRTVDMDRSEVTVHDNIPLHDVDIDRLVVDEKHTESLLIFRLAEASTTIVVHEKLRTYLISKGFDKINFIDQSTAAA